MKGLPYIGLTLRKIDNSFFILHGRGFAPKMWPLRRQSKMARVGEAAAAGGAPALREGREGPPLLLTQTTVTSTNCYDPGRGRWGTQ